MTGRSTVISIYCHIDCREADGCELQFDEIFGRECFFNEVIWAYDYGGRSETDPVGEQVLGGQQRFDRHRDWRATHRPHIEWTVLAS